jgi:hypothetical protein
VYIGGSLILLIVLPLIFLPLLGVAMYFPGSGGISAEGTVSYRSTKTLGFNEYWYESEDMDAGKDIKFLIDSTPGVISWGISSKSFNDLATIDRGGSFVESVSIDGNHGYEYIQLFLRPGSWITYNFTASSNIEFFIADEQDMNVWNNWGNPVFYRHLVDVTAGDGGFNVTSAHDYYVVWYNDEISSVNVNFDVDFWETDAVDMTDAEYYGIAVDHAEGTVTTTSEGRWYLIVYFDPMHSPEEYQEITFDVTFELGKEGNLLAWAEARPWLVFFGLVAAVLLIMAVFNRRKQKEFKTTASDTPKAQTQSQTVVVQQPAASTEQCPRCHSPMKSSDIYCKKCGEKREGRRVGAQTTTARHEVCEYCGANLIGNAKFCTSCGSRIK